MYHVTLRGNHRQDIFFTSDDRSLLTRIMMGATEVELRSPSRLVNVTRARAWITDTALCTGVASVASLASYFHRDASSVRQAVQSRRRRKSE